MPRRIRRRRRVRQTKRTLRIRGRRLFKFRRGYVSSAALGSRPHFFTRHIGMTTVWAQQGSANNAQGLSVLVAGTGSSVAINGNRFVVTAGANTTTYLTIGFALQFNNLPGVAEFAALFDQYKIKAWRYMIIPGNNTAEGLSAGGLLPVYHSVLDFDDATPPPASESGLNEIRERVDYKVQRGDGMNKIVKRYVAKPCIQTAVLNSAGTLISSVVQRGRWLDCADLEVPHFGAKWLIEMYNPSPAALGFNFEMMAKVYLAVKNPH